MRDHVHGRLNLAFEELAPLNLKNIARPVEAFVLRPNGGVTTSVAPVSSNGETLPVPDMPSIAVLPFANMSGDPSQQYFADGMVEEIITALPRTRRFFVISRNSSFTYKGKSIDVRQVGRELGVRYVLEGSIRKAASQVRISTQLIDSASGGHVWATRFEGDLDDVFALQDDVATSLVRAIAPTVRDAEIARAQRMRPTNMCAYDYYLRALPNWYKITRESSDEALRLLDQALLLDPFFAQALSLKAQVLAYRSVLGWTQPVTSRHSEMLSLAHEAVRRFHPQEYSVSSLRELAVVLDQGSPRHRRGNNTRTHEK